MSYASILKENAPPIERQVHPDTSLLTTPADAHPQRAPSPSGSADADFEADKVAVVNRDEIEKLRHAMEHADESHVDSDFDEARRHQQEREAEEQQARLKAQAQAELKKEVDKVEPVVTKAEEKAEEVKKDVKQKGKEVEKEVKEKSKEVEKEVKEKWAEGKKEAKEFADKAEKEIKKDAKKLQKKASEVEKEGRALAKQYPYAASGIAGLVNFTLLAVPAYFAYKHWNQPRWDRRVVSAVAVGLTAVFGAESALGWFEYKQEQKGR